jgi:tRNA pseudouridine55 synthase
MLLIDKPAGMTSHDVVDAVRRIGKTRKVGHAGTLDPFATGLLLVAVGPATKSIAQFVGMDKEYEAEFILGATSTTDDPEGEIRVTGGAVQIDQLKSAMQTFVGEIDQVPPAYSAIKIGGQKMYDAARKGRSLEAPPRQVRIDAFDLLAGPAARGDGTAAITVRIKCGSGTYIRAIARDLGAKLGVGGYVTKLRRTKIGPFDLKEAKTLEDLQKIGISEALAETARS